MFTSWGASRGTPRGSTSRRGESFCFRPVGFIVWLTTRGSARVCRTLNPNDELYSQSREAGPAEPPPPPLHVRNSSTPTSGNLGMRGGGTPGMGAEGSDDAEFPGPPKRTRRDDCQ